MAGLAAAALMAGRAAALLLAGHAAAGPLVMAGLAAAMLSDPSKQTGNVFKQHKLGLEVGYVPGGPMKRVSAAAVGILVVHLRQGPGMHAHATDAFAAGAGNKYIHSLHVFQRKVGNICVHGCIMVQVQLLKLPAAPPPHCRAYVAGEHPLQAKIQAAPLGQLLDDGSCHHSDVVSAATKRPHAHNHRLTAR